MLSTTQTDLSSGENPDHTVKDSNNSINNRQIPVAPHTSDILNLIVLSMSQSLFHRHKQGKMI